MPGSYVPFEGLARLTHPPAIPIKFDECASTVPPVITNVSAVIVSRDRPLELRKTIDAVSGQNGDISLNVIVIDSSADFAAVKAMIDDFPNIAVVRSISNLGGAGGFALGILTAIAAGAEWVWLMDDDGRPYDDGVLATLLMTAAMRDLHAVSPAVLSTEDQAMFAFPYAINAGYVFRRDELAADAFLPSTAHLFNGLLIRSSSIFKVGLPDLRMFARGDEIDFLHRMRRARLRFGTTSAASFLHPSSSAEIRPIWNGRLHVVIPTPAWRRRCQFRNRAFNFSRHGMWFILALDIVRYPYFFLICGRDFAGFSEWVSCTMAGLRGRVGPDTLAGTSISPLDRSAS